jgi:hypothetical protein
MVTAPRWVSTVFGYPELTWWRWLVVALLGIVTAFWWDDLGASRRSLLAAGAVLAGATAYLWWRGWHLTGFWDMAALAGVVAPAVLWTAYNVAVTFAGVGAGTGESPVRPGRWRRRHTALRRRYPFASMLLDLEELAVLLGDEHAMTSAAARERCARLFESVATAADHLIRRARTESFEDDTRPVAWLYQPKPFWLRAWLRPVAGAPDALLDQRLNRCAASVVTQLRQYKRQVLLPGDGTWAELRQKVLHFAAITCERRWDSLPQPEPESVARFRARLAVSIRLVLVAAVGPAALVAYEVLPGTRPPAPEWVAFAAYLAWPLLTILIRADPDLTTKLDLLARWLPTPGKSGTGGQDRPNAPAGRDSGK